MRLTATIERMYETIGRDVERFEDDCRNGFLTVNEENGRDVYWFYDGDDDTEILIEVPEEDV